LLELYHGRTSTCAQKARLVLAEKGLEWKGHLMTLRGDQLDPAYLKLNPNGVVPTLIHDGNVVIESAVIMHYLDEVFPKPALMPEAPLARAKARMFIKLVDEYVQNAAFIISFATSNRLWAAALSPAAREEAIAQSPDPERAAVRFDLAEKGLGSAFVPDAIRRFATLLDWTEAAMAQGPYLAGAAYSLADVVVTPYVERLDRLRLASMWDKHPGVAAWYDRVRARPSYVEAVTKHMIKEDFDRYASFEPDPWPQVREILAA
jgi:glutathione S-transferase